MCLFIFYENEQLEQLIALRYFLVHSTGRIERSRNLNIPVLCSILALSPVILLKKNDTLPNFVDETSFVHDEAVHKCNIRRVSHFGRQAKDDLSWVANCVHGRA
jgi:hypothetical protein